MSISSLESSGIQSDERQPSVNISDNERLITGALLVLAGLRKLVPGLLISAVGGALLQRAFTGHCPAYEAMGIDTARGDGARARAFEPARPKPAHELYAFWRNFENLPRFMQHLGSVTCADGKRSHWTTVGPANYRVEWDAEIINDEPDRLIAWRSLGNADIDNAGSVRFLPAPGDRGTQLKVVIDYIPPAGMLGHAIAKLFGKYPEQQIREDIRRFKRLMELGEIPTNEGQPRGTCIGKGI